MNPFLNSLFTQTALHHSFLSEMSVGFATDGTGEALVSLLVAAIAHGIVQMPARARSTARRARTTVTARATVLKRRTIIHNGERIIFRNATFTQEK